MPTVRTGDIETYYIRQGEGPPVVFVHGALVDHAQWAPQLETFAEDYTVVAYDVRGHGRTGGSDIHPYSMSLYAADLRALIETLDLDAPVLVGLSNGGAIVQTYAATYPDEVAGLMLADTFADEFLGWVDRFQMKVVLPTVVYPASLVGFQRVERAMTWANELFSPGSSGDYEKVEALRADSPPISNSEFAKIVRAIGSFMDEEVEYGALTMPTLVLRGEHDPGFMRRHADRLVEVIPDADSAVVPGAGHASNLDNPEFFDEVVRDLLEEAWVDSTAEGSATAETLTGDGN